MLTLKSQRVSQPPGRAELDWWVGDAVAFSAADDAPQSKVRCETLPCQSGKEVSGSTATSGISVASAAYATVPNSAGFFGERRQWGVISGRVTTLASNAFVLSCGFANLNSLGLNVAVFSNGTLEFSSRTGGTWASATSAVGVIDFNVFHIAYAFSDSGLLTVYKNGKLVISSTALAGKRGTPATDVLLTMCRASAANANLYGNGVRISMAAFGSADMSARLADLSTNPWQVFKPAQRRVYFDMGAGGGGTTHTVTADPVEQGSTTTRPGLTQTHITTASAVAQGATVSRPAVTQTHVVEARPNLQASIVARPSVTQTHVVTARAVAQGSTVNAPAVEVGSITVVTARPVVQSSTVNAPSSVQTHIVTARPSVQGSTVGAPSIVQAHVLTAMPSVQGATVTRPGLTQTHMVTARAVTQGSVVNAPSVDVGSTPATFVTARPVAQGSTVNAPGIRQTHVTSARVVVQGSTINVPGLVQAHVVAARPAVQAGSVNKPWVTTGSGTFTGLSPADIAAIRAAVRSELSAELLRISEIAKLHGLVQGAPLVVTPTSRTAGDVAQTVNTAGTTTTVTRQ